MANYLGVVIIRTKTEVELKHFNIQAIDLIEAECKLDLYANVCDFDISDWYVLDLGTIDKL